MDNKFQLKRRQLLAGSAALGAIALMKPSFAQNAWPSRPVRLVVGYPPGGSVDVLARIVASELGPVLGQTVVVENRPGASSNIAASETARASPDGHTLLVSSTSVVTANPSLYRSDFDASSDLVAIDSIGRSAIFVVARNSLPADDIPGLVELSKKSSLTFGSAGIGTQPHLAGELLRISSGIRATHVPYKGSAPALQDLMGEHIDYMLDPGSALPYIQSGRVKLLGVISAQRSPFFPDVPTVSEQGVTGTDIDIWYGIWAPKGIPDNTVKKLGNALQLIMQKTSVKEQFANASAQTDVVGGDQFRSTIAREKQVFSQLIQQLGIAAV